jgi:site-specific recombinase XerD
MDARRAALSTIPEPCGRTGLDLQSPHNLAECPMQFRAAADGFLRACAIERQLSRHTVQAYACDLADFARRLPAGLPVAEVSTDLVKGYLEEMVDARRLALATVRRRLACLKSFFRHAAERGQAPDPFAAWRPRLARPQRLPRALSRGEVSVLLSGRGGEPQDPALPVAVRLMLATGLRVGELCRLRPEDVAPDGGALRIRGKGARDRIAYVADARLRRELRAMVEGRRRGEAGPEASGVDRVFVNRRGLALKPQSIRAKLRRQAAASGIGRRVTPHMLRHTAATLLIETGVDIRFVQRLLGHASIATTEIYTHVSDEALRATLERADVLAGLSPTGTPPA